MMMTGAEALILRNQIAIMTAIMDLGYVPGSPLSEGARVLLREGLNKTYLVFEKAKVLP